MPPQLPKLDHIILLLPLSTSPSPTPSIPSSISKAFTLTPGGTHADNLTSNTLILLADGSYIELLCFITASSEAIAGHWWGGLPEERRGYGWIDWCLLGLLPAPLSTQEDGAEKGIKYAEPIRGGRKRLDGKIVEWDVMFPAGVNDGQEIRGAVPFFCADVGDRELRVPEDGELRHKCGVLGVLEISVFVRGREDLSRLRGVWEGILGREEERGDGVVFEVGRVRGVEGLDGGIRVVLRVVGEGEGARLGGGWYGVGDVVFGARVDGEERGRRVRLDSDEEDLGGLWVEYV